MPHFETFFKVAGAILALTGVLRLLVQPRVSAGKRGAAPNMGVLWAVFCIAMGIAVVLMGAGVLPGIPRSPG